MRRASVYALALCCLAACRSPQPTLRSVPQLGDDAAAVRQVAELALVLDGRRDAAADTLYAPNALIVANARRRASFPRFAGVGRGGHTTVASAQVQVQPNGLGWAFVGYQWTGDAEDVTEIGWATFLMQKGAADWKIIHVHSSQRLPWQ